MWFKRVSPGDIPFIVVVYSAMSIFTLLAIFPLWYVLTNSLSSNTEAVTRGFYLIPKEWTFNAYGYLLSNQNFVTSFLNSIHITLVGTSLSITLTTLMAYALSKRWLKGRQTINVLVLFTMLFSGGMIPTFLVVRELGLVDSYWAIWLVNAVSSFYLIVIRSFFQNMPEELEEAARIDGCSEWRLLGSIVLPLSKPVLATFILFYMVGNWNTYFNAILYLKQSSDYPLQVYLRQMLIAASDATMQAGETFTYGPPVKMAAVVLTAIPLLIIYPFLQKYFAKGLLLGSLKG